MKAYAGYDPVTKRRHYLSETIPAGPNAERQARVARDRPLAEVAERRNPRTKATVDQLLERYLDQFDGAESTKTLYRGCVTKHISPDLGRLTVGVFDADVLDSFYAELRRCRDHCSGRPTIRHRTTREHTCDHRCGPWCGWIESGWRHRGRRGWAPQVVRPRRGKRSRRTSKRRGEIAFSEA